MRGRATYDSWAVCLFLYAQQTSRVPASGLAYSDSRIDAEEVRTHFERSYKEENYFRRWRPRIFEQIARLVDRYGPRGGRVLDIGAATGYPVAAARRIRPDLKINFNDLSRDSRPAAMPPC